MVEAESPSGTGGFVLYGWPSSPFVRKARILILEKGLEDRFSVIDASPFDESPDLVRTNPIAQIPALDLGDGHSLIGSALICAYIDAQTPQPRFIPDGAAQWHVRELEAVADAVLENAVRLRTEGLRPAEERSAFWTARWLMGLNRGLDRLESSLPQGDVFDLGVVAALCAVDYLSFRHPAIVWSQGRPALAALPRRHAGRRSVALTAPIDPPGRNGARPISSPLRAAAPSTDTPAAGRTVGTNELS